MAGVQRQRRYFERACAARSRRSASSTRCEARRQPKWPPRRHRSAVLPSPAPSRSLSSPVLQRRRIAAWPAAMRGADEAGNAARFSAVQRAQCCRPCLLAPVPPAASPPDAVSGDGARGRQLPRPFLTGGRRAAKAPKRAAPCSARRVARRQPPDIERDEKPEVRRAQRSSHSASSTPCPRSAPRYAKPLLLWQHARRGGASAASARVAVLPQSERPDSSSSRGAAGRRRRGRRDPPPPPPADAACLPPLLRRRQQAGLRRTHKMRHVPKRRRRRAAGMQMLRSSSKDGAKGRERAE